MTDIRPVVGCKFSDKIIYPETFEANPDSYDSIYSSECGIYKPHCGLDNVMLSWGHDEVSLIPSKLPCIAYGPNPVPVPCSEGPEYPPC